MDRPLQFNLNTLVAVGGFVITMVTVVYTSGQNTAKLETQQTFLSQQWSDFQKEQKAYNINLDSDRRASMAAYNTRMDAYTQTLTKATSVLEQHSSDIAGLRKKDEEIDARLGRMAEGITDSRQDVSAQLSTLTTQLALLSQAVTEIKQILSPTSLSVPSPLGQLRSTAPSARAANK